MNKNTNSYPNVNPANLRRAADLAESIEKQQAELQALLTGQPISPTSTAKSKNKDGKRVFSPEQKARISAGLKKKWAEKHAAKLAANPVAVAPVVA